MARADIPVHVTTPIEIHIDGQAAIVGPNDRLVIAFKGDLTHQMIDQWTKTIDKLGLAGRVLLTCCAELTVITEEEPGDE